MHQYLHLIMSSGGHVSAERVLLKEHFVDRTRLLLCK